MLEKATYLDHVAYLRQEAEISRRAVRALQSQVAALQLIVTIYSVTLFFYALNH